MCQWAEPNKIVYITLNTWYSQDNVWVQDQANYRSKVTFDADGVKWKHEDSLICLFVFKLLFLFIW